MIIGPPPPPPSRDAPGNANLASVPDWQRAEVLASTAPNIPSSIRQSVAEVDGLIHKADDSIARRREELRTLQLQRQLRTTPVNAATIGRSANLLARAQAVVPGFHSSTTNKTDSIFAYSTNTSDAPSATSVASGTRTVLPGKATLTRTALIAKAEAAVAAASVHLEQRNIEKNAHVIRDVQVQRDTFHITSPSGAAIQQPTSDSPMLVVDENHSSAKDMDHKRFIRTNFSSPPPMNQELESTRHKKYVDTPVDRALLRSSHDLVGEKTPPEETHQTVEYHPLNPFVSMIAETSSKRQVLEAMRDAASTPPLNHGSSSNSLLDARMDENPLPQVQVDTVSSDTTLLQPSSTPTLKMVKELNRIQQEYTSVMKRNLQLEKELEQLRQVVVEEDQKIRQPLAPPLVVSKVQESADPSTVVNRQLFLQHFLSDLVGKATEHGDALAIQWAQSQISSATSMEKWMNPSTLHSVVPNHASVVGSPTRRGRTMGSPTKHTSSNRNRMKSPQPTGRQRTTWKEYMDDGERDTAMRALQAVSAEYTSDLATYVIRKPHGENVSLTGKTSDDDFGGQVHWIASVYEYTENSTVDDPTTLEVMAYIHDDSSVLLVQGDSYAKHGTKCIGDENNFEWKTYENDDSEDLLGSVVYIDVHGNEQEYLLDVILAEAYDIRERYCSSVLSAAAALSTSKVHGMKQHHLAPSSSILEEVDTSAQMARESVQRLFVDTNDSTKAKPLLAASMSNKQTTESPLSIPIHVQEAALSVDAVARTKGDHDIVDQTTSKKEDRTAHLPPRVPSNINLTTSIPTTVSQNQVESNAVQVKQISSPVVPKREQMDTGAVKIEHRAGPDNILSWCILFAIKLPFHLLMFFLVRLPWMILKTVVCSLLFVVFVLLLWLCLSDDNGAMNMGAGVNYKFVPPRVFYRGLQ